MRLLAPRAELRLQIAGGSSMIDSGRLSYMGEALRALLVLEVREAMALPLCALLMTHHDPVDWLTSSKTQSYATLPPST